MLLMPEPDQEVLSRRAQIVAALQAIVPGEGVVTSAVERRAYESDGLTAYRQPPMVVVLPSTTAQVSQVMRYCHDNNVRIVPRGAGTSLSGGALPLEDAVLLALGKFNRILDIDLGNRCAVVQPGVTNLGVTHAVQHEGFYYAPIRQARSLGRSAATLPRTRVACIASNTASRRTTCSASRWC